MTVDSFMAALDEAAQQRSRAEAAERERDEMNEALESALAIIEQQREEMGNPFCFHCGASNPSHDPARPHWLDCEKHPARQALAAERERSARLEGALREALDEIPTIQRRACPRSDCGSRECAAVRRWTAALASTPPQPPAPEGKKEGEIFVGDGATKRLFVQSPAAPDTAAKEGE